ncbi:MAG: hypothetical protein SFY56_01440 [Bacteroidota bacterium]|nr:hypothetical protein [Bacteroidota bacterium]
MFSFIGIASLFFAFSIIGFLVYSIYKKYSNESNDKSHPFSNNDYCDYCGAKLIETPIGSSLFDSNNLACPRCGYDCKMSGD